MNFREFLTIQLILQEVFEPLKYEIIGQTPLGWGAKIFGRSANFLVGFVQQSDSNNWEMKFDQVKIGNDDTMVPMSQEEMPELATIPIDEMASFFMTIEKVIEEFIRAKNPDAIKVTGMDVGRAKAAAKNPGAFDAKRNNAYKYMLRQSEVIPRLGYDIDLSGNDIMIHKLAA
jgi:hypothetical protein